MERIRLIAGAKERIILSTFDFRADDGGLDILAAPLDAADRGVQVEVFADGFNSWVNMEGNPYFMRFLPTQMERLSCTIS